MKTTAYHVSNLGGYAPSEYADSTGYIEMHDSLRYADADTDQLTEWLEESRYKVVRAAAATELACRELDKWRSA